METVIGIWNGRRYPAVVDKFGGALIIGEALDEFQNGPGQKAGKAEMENEKPNEEPEVTTMIDVGTFVEKLIMRQDEFEAGINKRFVKTNELLELCRDQQVALRESIATLKGLISGKSDFKRLDPRKSAAN